MKKKILLVVSLVVLLVCLLAICVSAETVLKPQDNNNYGELSLFSEPIGRTDTYGTGTLGNYSPYMEDGETYARVVIGDGTTFYTFPTQYVTRNNAYDWEKSNGISIFELDLSYLNSAMEAATTKNPGWTKENIYRIEMPYNTLKFNGGTQSFSGYSKVIEIFLQPNSGSLDQNKGSMFWYCNNLETIHNLDTFVFRKGCLGGAFQNCQNLTSLTIGVSPEVTDPGENTFNGCKALRSVNIQEAFPNLSKIGKQMFQNCSVLTTFSSEGQNYAYVMPNSVTNIAQNAFNGAAGVKYISISPNVTYIGQAAFMGCTSLEFVDFNDNQNDVDFNNCQIFMNCTNLKAVSMPDNTDYITNRMFSHCTNLMAVYLPSATVTIETNGYGEHTSFYNCNKLYFVNEQFEVRDENGLFYGDDFVQPTRPDVYYFPSNLEKIFDRNEGIGFASCYNLNPTMVFPTTLQRFWINDGVFYECGKTGNKFTVVFLADMTDVRIGMRENRAKGISYVFANPADVDLSCVNIIDTSPNYTPYLNGDESVFFCASNKHFTLYNLGGSSDDTQYTNDNTTLVVDSTKHITSPRATKVTKADCVNPEGSTFYCFCGVKTGEEITAPALGHFAETIDEIVYNGANKFFEVGDIVYYCERCEKTHTEVGAGKASPIFATLGLSAKQVNGNAIMQSFMIDRVAMELYNSNSEYDVVSYGLVAGTKLALGENAEIFDNTGAVTSTKAGVVNISERTEKYDIFEMKVQGLFGEIDSQDGKIDLSKVDVYCCGYCLVQIGGNVVSYYASEGIVTETLSGAVSYETLSSKAQG